MKEKKKCNLISCPNCGREYLPAEIYLPKNFLGTPTDIEKNSEGKVEIFDGTTMDLNEQYCCDNCGIVFKVVANVNFKSYIDEKRNLSSEYISPLCVDKISLFEDISND